MITKDAGWPWGTSLSTDWMVIPGVTWGTSGRYAARVARAAPPAPSSAVVCAAGGPMIRPAEFWVPTLYPVPCCSETVTDSGLAGVAFG